MKARQRRTVRVETAGAVRLKRVACPTIRLVQIDRIELVETAPVSNAFVKLCPVVKASDKASFDASALSNRLRERGALSVVVSPRMVADTLQPKHAVETTDPRELVALWMAEQRGIGEDLIGPAHELVLKTMEVEGI